MLRTNLRYFNVDREVHSVLITSPAPGDGKTTVSWNLAAAAASVGSRVLVIEADLRHCVVGKRATVAPGSRLERCVVWAGAHLPRGDYRDMIVTPNRQLPLP